MYNPLEFLQGHKYDPFNFQDCEDINNISQILKSCETYDHTSFNNKIKTFNSSNDILSIVFNNIDGNASNFDSFTALLQI